MRRGEPVTQTVGAAQARQQFSRILTRVSRKESRVIVERNGIPVAAIVSADDLDRLNRLEAERDERRRLLERLREPFKGIPPEQIERDVADLIAEVRAEAESDAGKRRTA